MTGLQPETLRRAAGLVAAKSQCSLERHLRWAGPCPASRPAASARKREWPGQSQRANWRRRARATRCRKSNPSSWTTCYPCFERAVQTRHVSFCAWRGVRGGAEVESGVQGATYDPLPEALHDCGHMRKCTSSAAEVLRRRSDRTGAGPRSEEICSGTNSANGKQQRHAHTISGGQEGGRLRPTWRRNACGKRWLLVLEFRTVHGARR